MPDNRHNVTILLVEDDPGHARLIEKNMRRSKISNDIVIVDDGQKAIDFLFSRGKHEGSKPLPPLLILLDMNLPVINGYDILKLIKEYRRTKHIPVIILTTTEDAHEVSRCYELGCNVFITKPVEYDKFSDAIQKLGLFLSIVAIPNGVC